MSVQPHNSSLTLASFPGCDMHKIPHDSWVSCTSNATCYYTLSYRAVSAVCNKLLLWKNVLCKFWNGSASLSTLTHMHGHHDISVIWATWFGQITFYGCTHPGAASLSLPRIWAGANTIWHHIWCMAVGSLDDPDWIIATTAKLSQQQRTV